MAYLTKKAIYQQIALLYIYFTDFLFLIITFSRNEKLSKRKSVKSDVKKKTKKRLDKSVSNDAYTTIKSSAPKNKEGVWLLRLRCSKN